MKKIRLLEALFGSIVIVLLLGLFSSAMAKKINLRMGYVFHEGHIYHNAALKFADIIEQKTEGEIRIILNHSGAIISPPHELKALEEGVMDLAIISDFSLFSIPMFQTLQLPMIIGDASSANRLISQQAPEVIKKAKYLTLFNDGFSHIFSQKKITEISDFKSLNLGLRNKFSEKFFKSLGAVPKDISYREGIDGFNKGIIDALELQLIYNKELFEFPGQKFFVLTGHRFRLAVLAINQNSWNRLPPRHQKIIKYAAIEAGRFERRSRIERETSVKKKIEKEGIRIIRPNRAELREAAKPIYNSYLEKYPDMSSFLKFTLKVGNGTVPCNSDECRCKDGKCHPETDPCCDEE